MFTLNELEKVIPLVRVTLGIHAHIDFAARQPGYRIVSGCPLLGVKRTLRGDARMSAFDPKQTLAT
jgi:hypothetical protein